MPISLLRINNFRNLAEVELHPNQQGLNIICGDNASGKTSLLEAIYYLSLARSFRTATASRLIQHSADYFSLFCQLVSNNGLSPIGIKRHLNGDSQIRISEKDITATTELAYFLPLRLMNSHSHYLVEEGPALRRKYLDWGIFYQSESFSPCWRQFERALKQRNAILRDKKPKKELDIWTIELIKYGTQLDQLRRDYVQKLLPFLTSIIAELITLPSLEIVYQPGWNESQNISQLLTEKYADEYRTGYTQWGPHRADLHITINQIPVRYLLSRGQQKLLTCAMIVAQGNLLNNCTNKALTYLVDDLPSELDAQSKTKLLSLLTKQETQVFITAIEHSPMTASKMFHVKHGHVEEI